MQGLEIFMAGFVAGGVVIGVCGYLVATHIGNAKTAMATELGNVKADVAAATAKAQSAIASALAGTLHLGEPIAAAPVAAAPPATPAKPA